MDHLHLTLLVGLMMLASYIWGRLPYGMTALTCCLVLQITGVLTGAEAWGGFGNTTVFLFASVFVLGAGLMKTSFISKVQNFVKKYGSSEKRVLWFCMAMSSVLAMLTSATASGATMLPMISVLSKDGKMRKSRILKPVMDAGCMAFAAMPFGMGAAFMEQGNSYLETLGSPQRLSTFDALIARGPVILITVLFLGFFGYKFLPANDDRDKQQEEVLQDGKKLDPIADKAGIVIFFASICMMIVSALMGIPSHYAPLIGSILMVAFGVVNGKEAFAAIDLNTVCIFAGSLSYANALTKTGAADWIARVLTVFTGKTTNEYVLVSLFLTIPFLMTQFMGNIPVINLTMPIAAIVSVNAGINPVAIMTATVAGATLSITTPMAAGVQALIMEPGRYSFWDYLKEGIPTAIVFLAAYVLWMPIVFPLH